MSYEHHLSEVIHLPTQASIYVYAGVTAWQFSLQSFGHLQHYLGSACPPGTGRMHILLHWRYRAPNPTSNIVLLYEHDSTISMSAG